jgi:hypothetical protein
MRKILFILIFISFPSLSNECFSLVENHRYELKGGVEYCLEVDYQYVNIMNIGSFDTVVEISDYEKRNYALSYSNEIIVAPDIFWMLSYEAINVIVIDGVVYIGNIENKVLSRKKRAINAIKKAVRDGGAGSLGAAYAGGNPEVVPILVGASVGAVSGIFLGPTGANFVAGYVTTDIILNKDKPRPPLIRIDTSRGLERSVWSRTSSTSGNSSRNHSSGGNAASCGIGCH